MPKSPAKTGNALEVEGLSVRFGDVPALDNVSFEVAKASSLAIIGPNGAGKTVLFNALIGALPHDGTVRWGEGTRLGYVPQKLDIERDLPITGNDLLHAKAMVSHASAAEVTETLATVGLGRELMSLPIGALSGGKFQLLLLAVALVGRPTVLMLDEPTAGVDEPGQQTVNDLIDRLRAERGMTTLLISHDLSIVYRHANNVLCLSHGRATIGLPQTILTPDLLQKAYGSHIAFHVHDHGV